MSSNSSVGDFPPWVPTWPTAPWQGYPMPQPFNAIYPLGLVPPGCICPAGANVACENPHCPRKPAGPPNAGGAGP